MNSIGHYQNTNFRIDDLKNPRKIKEVLYYDSAIPYQYILNTIPNVVFA